MVVGTIFAVLGPMAWLVAGSTVRGLGGKDRADAINSVRQILLQAVAGGAALTVVVFTGRTFALNRRGQVTDRYTKAIGLLASEKTAERIGGIYALEHVMVESERDHETVVQVFAAFIREHSPIQATRPTDEAPPHGNSYQLGQPPIDVQTALTVLGRRPDRKERQRVDLRRTNLKGLDLRNVNLHGADLREVDLSDADLREANLCHADLSEAHLEDAKLRGANLEWSILSSAHLQGAFMSRACLENSLLTGTHLENADLGGANLENSRLGRAYLKGAYLGEANLKGANLCGSHLEDAYLDAARLEGVDLSSTEGLNQTQIEAAFTDTKTKLPSN